MTYSFKKIPTRSRIRTILVDLADIIYEESETLGVYKPLASAAAVLLRESANAITNPISSDQMQKDLILSALDFSHRWEEWLHKLKYDDLDHKATRVLHEMLLRFFKGAIKNWRVWKMNAC